MTPGDFRAEFRREGYASTRHTLVIQKTDRGFDLSHSSVYAGPEGPATLFQNLPPELLRDLCETLLGYLKSEAKP